MSFAEQQPTYLTLRQSIEQIVCPSESLAPSLQKYLDIKLTDKEGIIQGLQALTQHFYNSYRLDSAYAGALAHTLAEATKHQPLWRGLFGVPIHQNDESYQNILHVALQIQLFDIQQHRELIQDCLRLIANCCANNNVNRKFCLEHGIMANLMDLAAHRFEVDTLVPTLYNVCIDYEDPGEEADDAAVEGHGPPRNASQPTDLASRKLAEYSHDGLVSYQILLILTSFCSNDRKSYLAELIEMACVVVTQDIDISSESGSRKPKWHLKLQDEERNTITLAGALAGCNGECRYHILRAISFLLSNGDQRRSFLEAGGHDDIWELVDLTSSSSEDDGSDSDEFEEELSDSRKQFLKVFYQLTGMQEFASRYANDGVLLARCTESVSSPSDAMDQTEHRFQKICSVIILAQLAASEPVRAGLSSNQSLTDALSEILRTDEDTEILYPVITLISRMCRTDDRELGFVQDSILQSMIRVMSGKGRGLAIPFEVVGTYKMMVRNRPQHLELFIQSKAPENVSVVSAVLDLFEKTIEAGTKLEVGHFFIELLRTMFVLVKELDDKSSMHDSIATSTFRIFLDRYATRVGEVFTFVCCQAEPEEQRVHGWFGMGMLSVWKQGRAGIVNAIDNHNFGDCLLKIAKSGGNAAAQNAKLMLSKMQQCRKTELSVLAATVLQDAGQLIGLHLQFGDE